MFRLIRIGRRMVGAVMLVAPLIAFLSSNQFAAIALAFSFWDPFSIAQYRMNHLSDDQYENEIEKALTEEDTSEAQALVAIAIENGRKLPTELVLRTKESSVEFGLRNAKDFLIGAATGNVTSAASIGGVLAADYVGIGDVRDVIFQGSRFINGENYDQLTLGLALAGLATVVPGTGPVDAGLSLLKTAHKAGRMSLKQTAHLKVIALKLVDVEALKRGLSRVSMPEIRMPSTSVVRAAFKDINWHGIATGDFTQFRKLISDMMPVDVRAAKGAFNDAIRQDSVGEIVVLASSTAGIISKGGIKTAFRALEHADDATELSRYHSLATRMGSKTSAVINVLGKNAIKLGNLLYVVIGTFVAALGWLTAASYYFYSAISTACRATKGIRENM